VKLRALLEYAGEAFSGWQFQPGQLTVQGELERALAVFMQSAAKRNGISIDASPAMSGSGRTDSGVHARGQIASFAWPDELAVALPQLRLALDAITAPGLVVKDIIRVDDSFDARFSPHIKCYSYRLLIRRGREGLFHNRAWTVGPDLNIAEMIRAARYFRGKHDFQSFRAGDCTASTTERTILVSELTRVSEEELLYVIHGSGFLKQMVRIIVGTLVDIGSGGRSAAEIPEIIAARNRLRAGQTAPSRGLTLEWVRYLDAPYYSA
jgi:tRNA pseudouridine38-40 synthase